MSVVSKMLRKNHTNWGPTVDKESQQYVRDIVDRPQPVTFRLPVSKNEKGVIFVGPSYPGDDQSVTNPKGRWGEWKKGGYPKGK